MKTRLRDWGLVLGTIVLSLIAFEVYLRINDAGVADRTPRRITMNGMEHVIFERPETLAIKAPTIAVVGDSQTQGRKCGHEQNLTGRLKERLHRESAGRGYNVVNLGTGGTAPLSYALRVRNYIAQYGAPKTVIVVIHENDVNIQHEACPFLEELRASGKFTAVELQELAERCRRPQSQHVGGAVSTTLHDWSYTYRIFHEGVAHTVRALKPGVNVGRYTYIDRWLAKEGLDYRLVLFGLDAIKHAANGAGARLLIVLYPLTVDLRPETRMVSVFKTMATDFRDTLHVPVYSGFDAFVGNPRADATMVWSFTDKHPNCKAHDMFAGWLLARYRENFDLAR